LTVPDLSEDTYMYSQNAKKRAPSTSEPTNGGIDMKPKRRRAQGENSLGVPTTAPAFPRQPSSTAIDIRKDSFDYSSPTLSAVSSPASPFLMLVLTRKVIKRHEINKVLRNIDKKKRLM